MAPVTRFKIDWDFLMARKGLTIRQLAYITGISYRVLYHMIAEDAVYVNRDVVGRLLLAMGVELKDPFGYQYLDGEATGESEGEGAE